MSTPDLSPTLNYLTFRLGEELFAIRVSLVREVLELPHITRVPASPAYMRGVVDVRGCATAVMDLRLRFGLPASPETLATRIIVMQLEIEDEEAILGGLADSVHEVVELHESQIAPPPTVGMRWRSEMLEGIAKRDGRFLILLNIPKILISKEPSLFQAHGSV